MIEKVREEYAQKFGNDLRAICQDARNKQARSGHKVMQLTPKSIAKSINKANSIGLK